MAATARALRWTRTDRSVARLGHFREHHLVAPQQSTNGASVPRVLHALSEIEAMLLAGEVKSNVEAVSAMGVLTLIEQLQEHVDEPACIARCVASPGRLLGGSASGAHIRRNGL